MSAKNILIGGGSGFIGTHLTKCLTSIGYNVTIISRMPGIKRITWHDLASQGLPRNTHAVINLAGQNVLDPTRRWTPGFKQNVWNSRVNTSSALVRVIEDSINKPDVFVNVSGVGLYRPNDDKVYTEVDVGEGYDFMSRLCLHWEKAATLSFQNDNAAITRAVKIRCGVVLGRDGGMIKSIKIPFWFGFGGRIATGNQYLPWIHINDICNLIKFSIEHKKVNGILNGVAPEIITNNQFTKAYSSAIKRPAIFPVPEFILNILFNKERAVLLTTGPKILPKRVEELGFKYSYPTIIEACNEIC